MFGQVPPRPPPEKTLGKPTTIPCLVIFDQNTKETFFFGKFAWLALFCNISPQMMLTCHPSPHMCVIYACQPQIPNFMDKIMATILGVGGGKYSDKNP